MGYKFSKALILTFGFCFFFFTNSILCYAANIYVGFTSSGSGLGRWGHAFLVRTQDDKSFYESDVFSYFADFDRIGGHLWVKSFFKKIPLGVQKLEFSQYLGYAVEKENRNLYIFRLNLSPGEMARLSHDIDSDFSDIDSKRRTEDYNELNSCWGHIARIINEVVDPTKRIPLAESALMAFLSKFAGIHLINPAAEAERTLNLLPKYYIENFSRLPIVSRAMPPFLGVKGSEIASYLFLEDAISTANSSCRWNQDLLDLSRLRLRREIRASQFDQVLRWISVVGERCPATQPSLKELGSSLVHLLPRDKSEDRLLLTNQVEAVVGGYQ